MNMGQLPCNFSWTVPFNAHFIFSNDVLHEFGPTQLCWTAKSSRFLLFSSDVRRLGPADSLSDDGVRVQVLTRVWPFKGRDDGRYTNSTALDGLWIVYKKELDSPLGVHHQLITSIFHFKSIRSSPRLQRTRSLGLAFKSFSTQSSKTPSSRPTDHHHEIQRSLCCRPRRSLPGSGHLGLRHCLSGRGELPSAVAT